MLPTNSVVVLPGICDCLDLEGAFEVFCRIVSILGAGLGGANGGTVETWTGGCRRWEVHA